MTDCVSGAGWRLIFLLLPLLLQGPGLLLQPASSQAQEAAVPKLIAATDAGPVYLQPLDAPGNPWAGQYSEMDAWIYANATLISDEEFMRQYGSGPDGRALAATRPADWSVQIAYVDASGFLLPMAEQLRLRNRAMQRDSPAAWIQRFKPEDFEKPFSGMHKFYAAGQLSAELQSQATSQWSRPDSAEYPPIPAWLGENPPLQTVFVPNGEILCVGPLGLRYVEDQQQAWRWDTQGLLWYRYNHEGRLLGTYDFGEGFRNDWMLIYWPERDQVIERERPRDVTRHHGHGTITLVRYKQQGTDLYNPGMEREIEAILACYDYDGRPLDPQQPFSPQRLKMGNLIPFEMLEQAYQLQLELGLTSADSASPYSGTPLGPQRTDSTPRPRPLIASRRSGSRLLSLEDCTVTDGKPRHWIEVRELSDPQNPYRAQYGPWDEWLRGQIGKQNPRIEAAFREKDRLRNELRNLLAREKREATEEEKKVLEDYGVRVDPADPWDDFTVMVDADGWQLPYHLSEPQEDIAQRERDLREPRSYPIGGADLFRLSAGGEMPAELAGELQQLLWKQSPDSSLRIPQWLIEQPVEYAIFAPDGEVITIGPLGSYDPSPDIDSKQRHRPNYERAYFRYSASGELLGSLPMDSGPLSALYDPSLLIRYQQAGATGLQWEQEQGLNLLRDKSTKAVTEAYDWNGAPLDTSQPLYGHAPFFEWKHWSKVRAAWEAQQPASTEQ